MVVVLSDVRKSILEEAKQGSNMKIQELAVRVSPLPWKAYEPNLCLSSGPLLATFDLSVWPLGQVEKELAGLQPKERDELHEQARLNAAFAAHCCNNFMKAVAALRQSSMHQVDDQQSLAASVALGALAELEEIK